MTAIEPAVRFYEEPPTEGMTVETHWADVWLSADDWAEAFEAPDPGTPHNEARDQVWEELLTILVDKHDDERGPGRPAPPVAARRTGELRRRPSTGRGRCSTPTDLVGDLWSVPAYLRRCAPWLEPRRGPAAAARGRRRPGRCPTCRCWTRPGSGSATRRRRGAGAGSEAAVAAEREQHGPGRRRPDRDRRLRDAA